MTEEKEIWSRISGENFKTVLEKLTQTIGNPKKVKRAAFQITDYDRQDLDTRIRITDGKPEIMQKIGDWNAASRNELAVELQPNADEVYKAYKTIRNLLNGPNVQTSIIQTESFLFVTEKYEIKLTHQSGKKDVYNYEIEVYDLSLDPMTIAQEYEIPVDSPEGTPEFWKEWSEAVNLSADKLNDEELRSLIASYL